MMAAVSRVLLTSPGRRYGATIRDMGHREHASAGRPTLPLAPNLLARQFTAAAPNRDWLADITYVPTMAQELTLAALHIAITNRRPDPGSCTTRTAAASPVRGARRSPPAGRARDDLLDQPRG
jgi:transposase InsO family protein